MISENRFGFEEESDETMWFNKILGQDGKPIMDWLSVLIDAHVDAAKDPYIISLNVNNATFDVVNLMIRAGAGEVTFDFISQPILREFAQEFSNATGKVLRKEISKSESKMNPASYAFAKVKTMWADELGITPQEFETDLILEQLLDPKTLVEDIGREVGIKKLPKAEQRAYYVRQLTILEHFIKLSKDAKDLTKVVMASRIDTKKYGTTPIQIRHFLNSIYNLEASDRFVNLDRLVRSDGVRVKNGTMLSTLLKNSALFGLEVMSDKSIYGSNGFSQIFGKVLEVIPTGSYSNKHVLNDVTEEIFALLASEFFVDKEDGLGVTKEYLDTILRDPAKSVFAQIQAVKTQSHKHYKELGENKFLNMMIIDFNKTFEFPWYIRTPFHTLDDRWETDDYIDDYLALTQHESPEVRELAKILYVYSFYTTGWRHRRHSFHTYTPTAMSKEIEVSEGKFVSYNEFIKKLRKRLADPNYTVANINTIKRHLFRNNWYNTNFVPYINQDLTTIIKHNGKRVGLEVEFKLNDNKYNLGRNKDGHHIFSPYIRIEDEDGVWLLEYAGYNDRTTRPIYRNVPRKGFSDMGVGLREYGFSGEQSILPVNNMLNAKGNPDYMVEKDFTKMMEENKARRVEDEENTPDGTEMLTRSIPFKLQEVTDKTRFEDAFFKDFTRTDSIRQISVTGQYTRSSVRRDSENMYLFTDNANRTSGSTTVPDG